MKPVAGELTDEEMFATGRVSRLEQALARSSPGPGATDPSCDALATANVNPRAELPAGVIGNRPVGLAWPVNLHLGRQIPSRSFTAAIGKSFQYRVRLSTVMNDRLRIRST